jgi:hypothetical protein
MFKVLSLFAGIGGFRPRAGADGRVQDRGVLRDRPVLPAGAGEALAGGSLL